MHVTSTGDLGRLIRRGREKHGWSQAELARRIGASRHWVLAVEKGKPSAEIGLLLNALFALGLSVAVSEPAEAEQVSAEGTIPARASEPIAAEVDEILARSTGARSIVVGYPAPSAPQGRAGRRSA